MVMGGGRVFFMGVVARNFSTSNLQGYLTHKETHLGSDSSRCRSKTLRPHPSKNFENCCANPFSKGTYEVSLKIFTPTSSYELVQGLKLISVDLKS